ncbi:hypothetical protein [uncultured Nitratireductor sp.]|uniref:hypothetical protein n=1 Tax=uncultured Nitratireductor sp. TaxID=520953 RepID=UPI0025DE15E3|nr:hypothetical protein [uncultured Nitratireductor sp.]
MGQETVEKQKRQWFDSRLSIGNIITILVVLAGVMGGWFKFDNRLSALEREQQINKTLREQEDMRLSARLAAVESDRQDIAARVIRIEERIANQGEKVDRILRAVERTSWQPD